MLTKATRLLGFLFGFFFSFGYGDTYIRVCLIYSRKNSEMNLNILRQLNLPTITGYPCLFIWVELLLLKRNLWKKLDQLIFQLSSNK